MRASVLFNVFIKLISSSLKNYGFTRKGLYFYLWQNGNLGLVNFQRSRANTAEYIQFTVDLGIVSARLWKFYTSSHLNEKIVPSECHWNERLGIIMYNQDKWWKIDDVTSLGPLFEEFNEYVQSDIPNN